MGEEAKRILVIDDASLVRFYYRDALERAGYAVDEALNGLEALEKLLMRPPDLLIVDINMPKMDGIELIKQIRTKSTHKFVPILVLTTESQVAKKQEAKSAGATGWIVKPFKPEQLLAVVDRVLG